MEVLNLASEYKNVKRVKWPEVKLIRIVNPFIEANVVCILWSSLLSH